MAKNYTQIFRSPLFQLKAGAIAFNFAGLFLYVAAAPVFITQHLGLGSDQFAWQFIPTVAGIFLGALSANRLAGKLSMCIGYTLLIGAALANLFTTHFPRPRFLGQ